MNALEQSIIISKVHSLRSSLFLISLLAYNSQDNAANNEILGLIIELSKMFKITLTKDDVIEMQTNLTTNIKKLGIQGIKSRNTNSFENEMNQVCFIVLTMKFGH